MHIFWGIVGVIISYFLTRFRHQVVNFTGPWGWAEKHLGAGQTATAYVFIGIFTFFVSITLIFGLLDDMVGGIIKPFLRGTLPK